MASAPAERAFLEAFDEYADALFRYASLRLSDRERAKDLTQESFIKAWDYVREGGDVKHWKSFLYRVLHNLIIDEYRRSKTTSLDALLEEDTGSASALLAVDGRATTEEALDDQMLIKRVRELIKELPESQRIPLSLRYVDGLSPQEIAELLDLSENVVSVRIHRAVARLKEWCGPLT